MTKKRVPPFPAEVRERAVRMVLEQQGSHPTQWAAMCSIAGKIGCSGETLRNWVRQAERVSGKPGAVQCRPGPDPAPGSGPPPCMPQRPRARAGLVRRVSQAGRETAGRLLRPRAYFAGRSDRVARIRWLAPC